MQPAVVRLAAGLVAPLSAFTAPVSAAARETVEARIDALRQLVERQQAQLDAQQHQLETQRAELDALKSQATVPAAPPAVPSDSQRIEELERKAAQSKLAAQETPVVRMNANRPSITSADGRSSIAVRANVQLDYAHYNQAPAGPPETDFRRGSVGANSRENDAARDLSDGAYFRRARTGVEGVIARDFAYRFLLEFGGSGTEGPSRINDAYLAYTGLAPFTFQLGAFSPPANLADGTPTEDLLFIERATPAELSRALGGADGRFGVGTRIGGARWLGALTLTGRPVNDAESFDSQQAAVGRLGGLVATAADYNVHLGVNGTYVIDPAQQSLSGNAQYPVRFRDRPEIRVDSTRLVDRLNPAGPDNLTPFGSSPATPPLGVDIGQSLDVYALRSQFSF